MLLAIAITRISKNLEDLHNQDGEGISSHSEIKEKGLRCLLGMLEQAPDREFIKLIESCDNNRILFGYLLSVLCKLIKLDKSRQVRILALTAIQSLLKRLEQLHTSNSGGNGKCCIAPIITTLPGVSSTLFKFIMSDTKLPKTLLITAIQTLTKLVTTTFLPCQHQIYNNDPLETPLTEKHLVDVCDNLFPRISVLLSYVSNHSRALSKEVIFETLDLCLKLVSETRIELLTRTFKPIISFTAFSTSIADRLNAEVELKRMLILDSIRDQIENCGNSSGDRLDVVVFDCLFKLLDNLENECLRMLMSERKSQLATLNGLLALLPNDILSSLFEVQSRRDQYIKIMTTLVEFSAQQPILFLTDTQIDEKALELRGEKIYTIEKRFSHIDDQDLELISNCCQIVGQNSEWSMIVDAIRGELVHSFSEPSKLFIASLIIKGFHERTDLTQSKALRFTSQMIAHYGEQIQEKFFYIKANQDLFSEDILIVILAIETLVILLDLHLKIASDNSDPRRVIVLKDLLCPLLNWCSSKGRAISEASLNSLALISRLYGHKSTKDFIENNIDYIVDGVMMKLDNFACNTELTNVLAITFKLSSMESFYYFKDVYRKVFEVLGAHQFTEKSKSIALLFYRTLLIMNEWKDAVNQESDAEGQVPLTTSCSVKSVLHEIDIDRRIDRICNEIEDMQIQLGDLNGKEDPNDEAKLIEEIKSGRKSTLDEDRDASNRMQDEENEADNGTKKTKKPDDIALTETILHHCIALMMSPYDETKIYALKAAACGFKLLRHDEDALLPLVHKLWTPLTCRLNGDYGHNLEVNLCAFECLVAMASSSKDFIKKRTLEAVIPRLCLFLETQASLSRNKKTYEPYCMTMAYKCQFRLVGQLGELAYHLQLGYNCLWRIISTLLLYLNPNQVSALRDAAKQSLHFVMALDADCVWYLAKQANQLHELPFELIFEATNGNSDEPE